MSARRRLVDTAPGAPNGHVGCAMRGTAHRGGHAHVPDCALRVVARPDPESYTRLLVFDSRRLLRSAAADETFRGRGTSWLPRVEKNYNSTRALRDARVSAWHMCLENQTDFFEHPSMLSRPRDVRESQASPFGDRSAVLSEVIGKSVVECRQNLWTLEASKNNMRMICRITIQLRDDDDADRA